MPSPDRHVIVDGSNIATEGRSLPSLEQLDEAVQAFQGDNPDASVTVIVDATFAHRIAKKERKAFDAAVDAGEIIVPPAGAIGRGDAFILQVAAKGDAEVLSNDSFQEFHGEHKWLFDEGRLIGAKPVEGIGWVFVDRVPVRGPESRRATRSPKKSTKRANGSRSKSDSGSKAKSKSSSKSGSRPASPSSGNSSDSKPRKSSRSRSRSKTSSGDGGGDGKATEVKQDTSRKNDSGRNESSKSSKSSPTTKELNSPSEFLGFVTKHSIGDVVRGTVERFSSHGCYLRVSDAQCYLPLKAMGDPPPSKARDLVSTGGEVEVRIESLDAERRGINVELIKVIDSASPSAKRRGRGKQTQPSQQSTAVADGSAREANPTRSETNVASKSTKKPAKKTAKKASAKKAGSARKAPAKKTAAKRSTKRAPAKKTANKAPAKKTARKASAKKTAKKSPARKTAAKKSAKKAPAKKSSAKKTAAKKSAKKAPAKKTARKAPAKKTAKKSPARKTAAKKSAKQNTAKKTPAKATASKRAQKATAKKTAKRSSRR